jgi:16S rRNA (cytosine1402-N4)-methyltransferase
MHVPVLLHEVIGGLSLHEGDTVVDATVGGAGYTRAMCQTVGKRGTVVGFDLDSHALSLAAQTLSGVPCALHLVRANFRTLDAELARLGLALQALFHLEIHLLLYLYLKYLVFVFLFSLFLLEEF